MIVAGAIRLVFGIAGIVDGLYHSGQAFLRDGDQFCHVVRHECVVFPMCDDIYFVDFD